MEKCNRAIELSQFLFLLLLVVQGSAGTSNEMVARKLLQIGEEESESGGGRGGGGGGAKLQLKNLFSEEEGWGGSSKSQEERLKAMHKHDSRRLAGLSEQIGEAIAAMDNETSQFSSSLRVPISAGPGVYLMQVTLGTPPKTFHMIMDTGSSLIWTQCQPCDTCFKQNDPIFAPSQSTSFTPLQCASSPCQSLVGRCASDSSCSYSYAYANQASTMGTLSTETLLFPTTDGGPDVVIPGVAFGCGNVNQGNFVGAAGIVGMGQGITSLPSQLSSKLGRKFSYCLVSQSDASSNVTSSLILGDKALPASGNMEFTPIIVNPFFLPSLYYVRVLDLAVDGRNLNIPNGTFDIGSEGDGGMALDSGTTFTYLPSLAFDYLESAFDKVITNLPKVTNHPYFPVCYNTSSGSTDTSSPSILSGIPALEIQLEGGVNLKLPLENYFFEVDSQGTYCLAMIPSAHKLKIRVIGNMVQQNYQVLHDLDNLKIGFLPNDCSTS